MKLKATQPKASAADAAAPAGTDGRGTVVAVADDGSVQVRLGGAAEPAGWFRAGQVLPRFPARTVLVCPETAHFRSLCRSQPELEEARLSQQFSIRTR